MRHLIITLIIGIFGINLPAFSSEEPMLSKESTDYLAQQCWRMGGEMIQQWACSNSSKVRNDNFCRVYDNERRPMIFNGCSWSFGDYGKVFFQACVYHDFCYHHEPTSNGYSKDDCDNKFLLDMIDICRYQKAQDKSCESSARWFYRAVYLFGGSSWACSKEQANYPRHHI